MQGSVSQETCLRITGDIPRATSNWSYLDAEHDVISTSSYLGALGKEGVFIYNNRRPAKRGFYCLGGQKAIRTINTASLGRMRNKKQHQPEE